MRNLVMGGAAAIGITVVGLLVTVGGEHGWKIALAAVGLVLWVLGGVSRDT